MALDAGDAEKIAAALDQLDRLAFSGMMSIWAALPTDVHRRLRLVRRQCDDDAGIVFEHGCQAFLPWADRVAANALPEGTRRKTLSGCSTAPGEHARPSPNPWRRDATSQQSRPRGAYHTGAYTRPRTCWHTCVPHYPLAVDALLPSVAPSAAIALRWAQPARLN
jgi:hypothetical protein